MARIVVCGYMIRYPLAGNVMAYLHYVLGLIRLGHEVLYLEESGWPESCYNPVTHAYGNDPAYGIQNLESTMAGLDVTAPICYVERTSRNIRGLSWRDLREMLVRADLLLNIGGVCWLPEFRLCRRRGLIDMDPLFTQVGAMRLEGFEEYHAYFTYGCNIGKTGCAIPTRGIPWRAIVPPVVPEVWGRSRYAVHARTDEHVRAFTTIGNWRAYGSATYNGEHYGQKDEEFLRLLAVPSLLEQRFEVALAGMGSQVASEFRNAGWTLRNSSELSLSLQGYQEYIGQSRGEFSAAKHAYVKTRSGWFSDRSVCYLASSRPVVLQNTGFSDWLATGAGVMAFSSLEEAVDCVARVNRDYLRHCLKARELAEQVFGYRVVLPKIVDVAKW